MTLVLGIGNLLLGDEGVGVHAARILQEKDLPAGTKVLEVGTSILDVLPELKEARRLIVLDAIQDRGQPGTVYRIPHYHCRQSKCIASMHGFDLFRVLALTERNRAPQVLVIGVEPAHLDWSMELSPQVSDALPFMIDAVLREIECTH